MQVAISFHRTAIDGLIARRRPGLAFTLRAMGSREHNFYNAAFRRAGYEEIAAAAQRLWLDRRRDEAAALIPDDLVNSVNAEVTATTV